MITLNLAGLFTGCFTSKNEERNKKDTTSLIEDKKGLFNKITYYLTEFNEDTQNKEKTRYILQEILNTYKCNTICINLLDGKGNLTVYMSIGIKNLSAKQFHVKVFPIYKKTELIGVLLFGDSIDISPDPNLINIIDVLGKLL